MIRWLVEHRRKEMEVCNEAENVLLSVDEIIEAFLSTKAESTQSIYKALIADWKNFLDTKKTNLLTAVPLHAELFVKNQSERKGMKSRGKLEGEKISKATVFKKIACLKRLYDVLIQHNYEIKINPFLALATSKSRFKTLQKRPTEMISFDAVKEMLSMPDITTKRGRRDKALLSILFGGALRRDEAVKLKMSDVHFDGVDISIILRDTKNGEDAEMILSSYFTEALLQYQEQRYKELSKIDCKLSEMPFFCDYWRENGSPSNKHLNSSTVRLIFKRYATAAGYPNATPHSARATAITKLLSDGVSHRAVQDFSRHSSIQMVEYYDKRRYEKENSPSKKLSF